MGERSKRADAQEEAAAEPADFASTVESLERLVERLESSELSLEESLAAFEEGIRLTRDAQRRLDEAELRVRTLTEGAEGGMTLTPFSLSGEDESER